MAGLDPRYTQVGFNLTPDQVCSHPVELIDFTVSYLFVADLSVTPLILPLVVSTTKSSVIIAWQVTLNNNSICNEYNITWYVKQ